MIKIVAVGLVIVAATLGGAVFAVQAARQIEAEPEDPYFGGLDYVKTEIFGVPVLEDGVLEGYLVQQWVFTVDARARAKLTIPPELIMTDEAFRAVYAERGIDFDSLDRIDFEALSTTIREGINARLGQEVIKDVLVQKFDYVDRGDLRDGRPRSLIKQDQGQ